MKKLQIIWIVLLAHISFAYADIKLPALFSDNMMLQYDMKVPIWGWADPGEKITVELGGHVSTTVANNMGKWKLNLGPLDLGGPFELEITGNNRIVIKNVLVGEIWICSGQSNMAMTVEQSLNSEQEIKVANYPQIRYFQVKRYKSSQAMDDVIADSNTNGWLNKWEICSPSNVGHYTAVGYFFARELHLKMKVPIGIISTSWGGTTAEAWTPIEDINSSPELKKIINNWPDYNNDEEWLTKEYEKYLIQVENAKKKRLEKPLYFNQPSVLYNGMISPIIPFGIRGVTWYQGESNAYRAYQYRELFPTMIKSWRKKWGQGNFPFLFVQLANYYFEPQNFPELREAQSMTLSLSNTGMAVAIDIGNAKNIHPKNKQEVGRRLSLAARKIAYGEHLVYSGPIYQYMLVEEGKCILSFKHTGEGLTTKENIDLKGFIIAGKDRKFVEAWAKIQGDRVIVWSEDVINPVAIRYAWANHPEASTLYNLTKDKTYLPASPFRTDDWPGITIDRN